MTTSQSMPARLTETIPAQLLDMLGPPPLLEAEDPQAYGAMMGRLVDAIRPKDVITWMMIRDLVDHRFEVARYRGMKVEVMRHVQRGLIEEATASLHARLQSDVHLLRHRAQVERDRLATLPPDEREPRRADVEARLETDIRNRQALYVEAVEDIKQNRDTGEDLAERFEDWAARHDRLDALLQAAERRFRTTLADLERHLEGFARALCVNLERIIDAGPDGGSAGAEPSAHSRAGGNPQRD